MNKNETSRWLKNMKKLKINFSKDQKWKFYLSDED